MEEPCCAKTGWRNATAERRPLEFLAGLSEMKSVADDLRASSRLADLQRTPAERLRLALALGDADCELLAASRGISLDAARRAFARRRQHGRVRSRSHEDLLA